MITGSGSGKIKSEIKTEIECPNCKEKGYLELIISRWHFHVFWIPVFPFWKYGKGKCNFCNFKFLGKDKKISDEIKYELSVMKSKAKGPIWQFSGLFIGVFLLIMLFTLRGEFKDEYANYIENPKVGDVYNYRKENLKYSTIKVMEIRKDTLVVKYNLFSVEDIFDMDDITDDINYSFDNYIMTHKEIRQLFQENVIYAVDRNNFIKSEKEPIEYEKEN
ncbi:hypothetical protein [Aureivirga sp. CE67]|uniref:hypothetical protein n=1 Tax=Aureivirga sp. CE67 TaxID=1788983 RepID=UPI0018C8E24D|nr:hypothetical protein [Aureivirga sp. CE67]